MSSRKYLILIILPAILASCATEKEASFSIPEKENIQIGSGEVSKNSSYIGYAESPESSNLGAKTPGRIVIINAQKGDRVKSGQVLAVIDAQEAKENLSSASNILQSTESVYSNTSELLDAQIASMKEKVSQSEQNITLVQSSLNGTTTGLSDTQTSSDEGLKTITKQVEQSELALDTTKTQYDNTKSLLDQKEKDIYLNAQNTLHSAGILAGNLMDFTDALYGVSDKNKHANDSFESYLCAKDSSIKSSIESSWMQNETVYETWKKKIDTLDTIDPVSDPGKTQILTTLKESQTFFESLRTFANLTHSCLESSITAANFSDTSLNGYKTQISTYQSNIESSLLSVNGNFIVGIKGSIQNIGNITNERTLQLSLLDKQIKLSEKANEVAKQNYTQYQAGATGKINEVTTKTDIAKSQLEIAKRQYDETKAGFKALEKQKDTQLSTISTQMANIRGNKDLAGIAVSGATVVAPFDGVITDKFASVGQVVGSGLPIFTIARDENIKLKILVGENDRANLKVGDEANIHFGDNGKTLTGSIKIIQPFADTLSKKVPIEIWMPNQDKQIILGSYADISFKSTPLSGKTIPYRFVEYSYGKSVLNVKKETSIEKVEMSLKGCNEVLCAFEGNVNVGETVLLP